MEIKDKRTFTEGQRKHGSVENASLAESLSIVPDIQYDNFRPTLIGCTPVFDTVLLRELRLSDDSVIVKADAFREPCLFAEVVASGDGTFAQAFSAGDVVRTLKDVGTTIDLTDAEEGERYFTVDAHEIMAVWRF